MDLQGRHSISLIARNEGKLSFIVDKDMADIVTTVSKGVLKKKKSNQIKGGDELAKGTSFRLILPRTRTRKTSWL